MLGEEFAVDARPVVEPFGVARRHEFDEVLEPLARLRQQHQVVVRLPNGAALAESAPGRHVGFATQDRLDPLLARLVVEHDGGEHVAVFSDRHGRNLLLRGLIEQFSDAAGAVEQRVFRVEMKVDELGHQSLPGVSHTAPSVSKQPGAFRDTVIVGCA